MSLELIIGRSGAGKSRYIAEDIIKIHAASPRRLIYYLAPEQTTFSIEYELSALQELGGLGMIEVLSFERLAKQLLEKYSAKNRVTLDPLGKIMLLRRIIAAHSDELEYSRAALKHFGYLEAISETLSELERSQIDVHDIAAILAKEAGPSMLCAKTAELAVIQQAYAQSMSDASWIDESCILSEAAELLAEQNVLNETIVYIDGFEYFTKQQLAFIAQIMKQTPQLTISLCMDHSGTTPLFAKQQRNCRQLEDIARENACACHLTMLKQKDPKTAPALLHLEASYDRPDPLPLADTIGALTVIECQNMQSEVETAAVIIRSLVREQGLRYKDIAVMVADISAYQNYFAKTFNLYDIPYFQDENIRIFTHPLTELIDAVFEIYTGNWSYQSVFRYLRSDLLCLEKEEIDFLENYCLACGIKGAASWLTPKDWYWQGRRNDWESQTPWSADDLFHLDNLRRRIAEPLQKLFQQLTRAQSVEEILSALMLFLEEQLIPERLDQWQKDAIAAGEYTLAQTHGQIWDTVCAVFAQLVEICGSDKPELNDIAALLQTAFSNIALGKIPLGYDQVFIGSPKRSRLSRIKAVVLLGLNEGQIPAKVTTQSIFSLPELNILRRWGMADALEKIYDEEFSIYKTLTAPAEKLYLCYALADGEGKSQRRSSLLNKIGKMFAGDLTVTEEDFLAEHFADRHISLSMALNALSKGDQADIAPEVAAEIVKWYEKNQPAQSRIIRQMQSIPQDQPVPLRGFLPEGLKLSVSAIEKYQSCPYAYFLRYTLRLQEREIYELDKMNIGQFYHKALEELTALLLSSGLDWSTVSDEELAAMIKEVIAQLLPQLQNEILLSSGRYRFLKDKLYDTVSKSALELAKHSRRGDFHTLKSEMAFGFGENEFSLTLDDGTEIYLRGRIDLLEEAHGKSKNYLRIVDFKSGNNDLALDEVYYGLKIQLITYLSAALKNMPGYEGAGVLYRYIKNPFIKGKTKLTPDEAEAAHLKEIKPRGLLLGEFEPLCLADKDLISNLGSDILPLKLKKDGKEYLKTYGINPPEDKDLNELFDQNSAVVSREQFNALNAHNTALIKKTAAEIMDGNFAVRPYQYKNRSGCDYCPYGSICRIDVQKKPNYHQLRKISKAEIWQKIEEERS